MSDDKFFAIYTRGAGVWGWIFGWALVNVGPQDRTTFIFGHVAEPLYRTGTRVMMIEKTIDNKPIPTRFWFKPKDLKILRKM